MQIARIEVIRIAIPNSDVVVTRNDAGVPPGVGLPRTMESLLVKVTTDDGRIGWGEAFGHRINSASYAALVDLVAPYFIGARLDLSEAMTASPRIEEAHKAFHLFGRTGPALYAISAIDIALWDIKAQALGKPLYQLLGGTRNRLTTYASLVTYNGSIKATVYNVMQAYTAGFRHIKLHETAFDTIQAVRQALPPDAELMVDVNCAWPPEAARVQAENLRQLGLAWLEEPIWPPDDFESLAALRAAGVPLAAGENASGIDGFARYLKIGVPSIIQPSVIKLGGVSAMIEAFRLGRQYKTRVQPHCFFYGAGLLATAHVIAALDDTALLEVPWVRFSALLSPEAEFRAQLQLSDAPGLGFVPDQDVIDRHVKTRATVQ